LERRQGILEQLAMVVEEGRTERPDTSRMNRPVSLTGQGVVGGVLTVLYARLLRDEPESLRGLLGELMAMIVLPYLGPAVARREQGRPVPAQVSLPAGDQESTVVSGVVESLAVSGMRLTHRTLRVLQALGEFPGSSNRQLAERSGIHDQGQISKLLARLQRFGLLINGAEGARMRGQPNEWALTLTGEQVVCSIGVPGASSDREWAA
jgi:hypothetical protein